MRKSNNIISFFLCCILYIVSSTLMFFKYILFKRCYFIYSFIFTFSKSVLSLWNGFGKLPLRSCIFQCAHFHLYFNKLSRLTIVTKWETIVTKYKTIVIFQHYCKRKHNFIILYEYIN